MEDDLDMVNLIIWVVFGALVGWVASLIMRSDAEQGAMENIIIGILGALVGGFIARLLGAGNVSGFNLSSFVIALLGAMLLIAIKRTATTSLR